MPLIEIYRYAGIYTNVCPNTDAHTCTLLIYMYTYLVHYFSILSQKHK